MVSDPRAAIEALLPHRPPFLFVDRVADRGEGWIETAWRVPPDADFFRGHYPGNPVLPGVIASEFVFQSAALLVIERDSARARAGAVPVLARIADARFRRIARPGDELRARVTLEEEEGFAYHLRAEVRNDRGERVLGLRCVLALAEPESGGD